MTKDDNGHLAPSALVPFCSYQGNLLGQKIPELNLTICDKFEQTVVEGMLCYSLDIAKLDITPTGEGKTKGLFLLLDPNPYPLNVSGKMKNAVQRKEQEHFKLFLHTLARYTAYGPGTYKLNGLKSMTTTKGFEQLPVSQKNCLVHNQEECQTQKYLDLIQRQCNCTPWATAPDLNKDKVSIFSCLISNHQAHVYCGPAKEVCMGNQILLDTSCVVPCNGLYADISDEQGLQDLRQSMIEGNFLFDVWC